MGKKSLLFLYSHGGEILTGGQVYEDRLFRILKENEQLSVDRIWLNNYRGKWGRRFSPLKNLFLAGRFRRYEMVWFNSSHAWQFIPLMFLLRLFGVKTGVIIHHFEHLGATGLRRSYTKTLETTFLRGASQIILPSPYMNELCHQCFPKKEIHYWQIPFEAASPKYQVNPIQGNLLYIGTVDNDRKGLRYLIEAMGMLKQRNVDCRLTIVGKIVTPAYKEMLDRTIAADGLDVTYTGFVTNEQLDEIKSKADIFAFPSMLEGYGMAICESMVYGMPVVCFNNSAMPYTVKDDFNGFLVENRNVEAFADALARIITDRDLRARLSAGALKTVDTFMTPAKFRKLVMAETAEMLGI